MNKMQRIREYIMILLFAFLSALTYQVFVMQNSFAPAGINGIATMIEYKTGISMGLLSFIFNFPLCMIALHIVDRDFAAKSMTYTVAFSLAMELFRNGVIDISAFVYKTENGTSTILAPVAASVLNGLMFVNVIKQNGSTGGTDIIAVCIQKLKPHLNMNWLIFILNASVALASYVVYDYQIEPVLLCLIYCYIFSTVSDRVSKGVKEAVKFEIVSDCYEAISREIIEETYHSVTVMPATGMYTGKNTKLMVCVVNKREVIALQKILAKYPGTFAYTSNVTETLGQFNRKCLH